MRTESDRCTPKAATSTKLWLLLIVFLQRAGPPALRGHRGSRRVVGRGGPAYRQPDLGGDRPVLPGPVQDRWRRRWPESPRPGGGRRAAGTSPSRARPVATVAAGPGRHVRDVPAQHRRKRDGLGQVEDRPAGPGVALAVPGGTGWSPEVSRTALVCTPPSSTAPGCTPTRPSRRIWSVTRSAADVTITGRPHSSTLPLCCSDRGTRPTARPSRSISPRRRGCSPGSRRPGPAAAVSDPRDAAARRPSNASGALILPVTEVRRWRVLVEMRAGWIRSM